MITVSEAFKIAMKAPTRQMVAYLADGVNNDLNDKKDLLSVSIKWEGGFLQSVMREAKATYMGDYNLLDKYVDIAIGVVLADDSIEYIDYGAFKVVEAKYDKATDETSIKMYDKMYEFLQPYESTGFTYPATPTTLLQELATKLGISHSIGSIGNATREFDDVFDTLGLSYRNVLDQVCEATGSVAYINTNDELVVHKISATMKEELDKNVLNSLEVESPFGPITTVVLSRQPQEDNILQNL